MVRIKVVLLYGLDGLNGDFWDGRDFGIAVWCHLSFELAQCSKDFIIFSSMCDPALTPHLHQPRNSCLLQPQLMQSWAKKTFLILLTKTKLRMGSGLSNQNWFLSD